jgi:hypothetical protein
MNQWLAVKISNSEGASPHPFHGSCSARLDGWWIVARFGCGLMQIPVRMALERVGPLGSTQGLSLGANLGLS